MGRISGCQWSAFIAVPRFHVVLDRPLRLGESYAAQLFGSVWVFTLIFDTKIWELSPGGDYAECALHEWQ
jgi:hypothetical protein